MNCEAKLAFNALSSVSLMHISGMDALEQPFVSIRIMSPKPRLKVYPGVTAAMLRCALQQYVDAVKMQHLAHGFKEMGLMDIHAPPVRKP